jgi:photosystem II stability/assembly factor-like uncharacterized protein
MPSTIWAVTGPAEDAAWRGPYSVPNGLPNRLLTDLEVHPRDGRIAYATFAGFDEHDDGMGPPVPGHVFRTTDGGTTWISVGPPVDVPVNCITVDPDDPEVLYVGTDDGVFKTTDGAATWAPLDDGLPRVPVAHLVLNRAGTALFAVTLGRGVFRAMRAPAT